MSTSHPDSFPDLAADVLAPETARGHILVIDDEPDIRESLEALLTSEGYRVDLAPNATLSFLLTASVAVTPELPVSSTVTLTVPGSVADPDTTNNSATDGPDAVGVFADGFE